MLADTCEAAVGYLLYFPWPAAILQHNIFKNIFKLLYLTQEKYIFEENYSYGCSAHPQRGPLKIDRFSMHTDSSGLV